MRESGEMIKTISKGGVSSGLVDIGETRFQHIVATITESAKFHFRHKPYTLDFGHMGESA